MMWKKSNLSPINNLYTRFHSQYCFKTCPPFLTFSRKSFTLLNFSLHRVLTVSCNQLNLLKILSKMAVISVTKKRSGGGESAKRGPWLHNYLCTTWPSWRRQENTRNIWEIGWMRKIKSLNKQLSSTPKLSILNIWKTPPSYFYHNLLS